MISLLDVHYEDPRARAACVEAEDWTSPGASGQWTVEIASVAAYEPGRFYERELPWLLDLLRDHPLGDCLVVDGYVWLDGTTPGLGAHLFVALVDHLCRGLP